MADYLEQAGGEAIKLIPKIVLIVVAIAGTLAVLGGTVIDLINLI